MNLKKKRSLLDPAGRQSEPPNLSAIRPAHGLRKGRTHSLFEPEQSQRLDLVVRTTIHGFHVEQLNQYDQEGVFSYSTAQLPLGKKCIDVEGVRRALAGENYFELPGYSGFWSVFWPGSYQHQNLRAYIPFRLEDKLLPQTGPVVGVIEIDQNISGDLAEIANFRLIILVTLVVIMGLLFLVLRQIVETGRRHPGAAPGGAAAPGRAAPPVGAPGGPGG